MTPTKAVLATVMITLAGVGAVAAIAQGVAPAPTPPAHPMSFFVTSRPIGDGGNLGGLAGADAHCQKLATEAGRGSATWHAYLSTQGAGAVNARDRIGKGPWYNRNGVMIASDAAQLHGDTLEQARLGIMLGRGTALTEKGETIPGLGEQPNRHDILTGTMPDGRAFSSAADRTCHNWTSNGDGQAQLGHSDKNGGGNGSWNSSHPSRSCSQPALIQTGGVGLLYCFASE